MILVDFRALDTLGEIVVLAVAAAGVYSLLKLRPAREQHSEIPKTTLELNVIDDERITAR